MVRRLSFFALLGACGFDTTGTGGEVLDTPGNDAGADASTVLDAGNTGADGSTPVLDARPDGPPPDPARVTVSYAAGKDKKVYRFDMGTQSFTALPSAGCPAAEETAVMSDGTIFVTSSNNEDLFRVTPTGCTPVKTKSSFPYAFGTAPAGTVSAIEELVGYSGADYVRVDPTTGDVTTITSGALGALRPSGDLTAMGSRGFLSAQSGVGACPPNGDCIVEVSLRNGLPVSAPVQVLGFGIYGLAHSRGLLLLYANQQVFPYEFGSRTLGGSLAAMPGGANFTGAGAPPYPPQ